ncbi:hypothetical protein N0V95_005445 [Ascochyta clinopodiicola]|nr:hypothetical protein N0V95_005445 [Ascochyta clinopodiicola]
MEAAENAVDFHLTGGMVQFDSPAFWGAAIVSIAAGFLAPLPYNYIRLRKFGKASILYGYLSDSLPESYLNETDRTVIASFQACIPSGKYVARIRSVYGKIKSLLLFGRPPGSHRKLTRRQREEVVKRFILTLSDQQLATGLAILIAAVANQCTLTVWEFQLAFSLAWFSSTTHLATLDCLREYFLDHGAVRNWRVFGMIALLVLLMYSLVMSMASVNNTIPIQCTFYFFGKVQDSTELAQQEEIAREAAVARKHRGHTRDHSPGTLPLRAAFQGAYDFIELHDLEPLDPSHGDEVYAALLPSLKRFFYLETKLISEKTAALQTSVNSGETEKSLLGLKAHIVSSYRILIAQERALKVTTLTSLIEHTARSAVSAALGILVYIEDSAGWTTIVSFILFGLSVAYKIFIYSAYLLETWFEVSEADYKRLMIEARAALTSNLDCARQ